MLIGELAERAGTSTRSLRYYEAQGLVHADRSANGYRSFAEGEVRVVHEIRSLLAVGFALDDIRPFVACLRSGQPSGDACPDSVATLRRKLGEVEGALADLTRVRGHLRAQLDAALMDHSPTCSRPAP